MTISSEWENAPESQDQGPEKWGNVEPIPVRVVETLTENVAPEATSFTSFAIPVIGSGTPPVQVCPHRYRRYKAKFAFLPPANLTTIIYVSRVIDYLTSGALGNAFSITIVGPATPVTVSPMPDYDGMQPLYMVATQAGCTISVMDEGYKVVQ